MTSTRKLEGRVALITGIATGLGRAGAELFAQEGAAVVGIDVNEASGRETVRRIEVAGGQAELVVGDASDGGRVAAAVARAVDRFGKLDLLWGNAGIGLYKDVVSTTEDEWDRVMAVNLKSAYLLAHHGVPELIRAGGGTMVMTASTSAFVGSRDWAAYCASKGAMVMLCRAMALDHAADGIRVNCVCPGGVDTPLLDEALAARASGSSLAEAVEAERQEHPMGRVGRPEEVARAALFLSCADSSFTTGSALMVDGGATAQ
jgi:NAD(P)-dependent dehydrogenase (short-subunit alcohol dehydrogenase family)